MEIQEVDKFQEEKQCEATAWVNAETTNREVQCVCATNTHLWEVQEMDFFT
jgi:hypothetical protein